MENLPGARSLSQYSSSHPPSTDFVLSLPTPIQAVQNPTHLHIQLTRNAAVIKTAIWQNSMKNIRPDTKDTNLNSNSVWLTNETTATSNS